MAVFLTFVVLVALTVAGCGSFAVPRRGNRRSTLQVKAAKDWLLDSVGLLIQGICIPALQVVAIQPLLHHWIPELQGCLHWSPLLSFLVSAVAIDYLYYWNHRALHTGWLWQLHQVHHTVTEMDVLGTSRNSVWSSFFIVYLWCHALFLYLLHDASGYLIGVSLTAALDLWRHSRFGPTPGTWLHRVLSPWLILPHDHAWHHASEPTCCNYGANLKLWDRWHGTDRTDDRPPASLGVTVQLTLMQRLFYPFS